MVYALLHESLSYTLIEIIKIKQKLLQYDAYEIKQVLKVNNFHICPIYPHFNCLFS